jgi:hypothetical protein
LTPLNKKKCILRGDITMSKNLKIKDISNLTLEDAVQAYSEGMCCVCADGKLKHISYERKV